MHSQGIQEKSVFSCTYWPSCSSGNIYSYKRNNKKPLRRGFFYCTSSVKMKYIHRNKDNFLYESFPYFCFSYIKTWLLSSLVSASPEYGGKCRALRGDRGMFAYTGQNTFCWFCSYLFFCSYVSAHTCPFRRLRRHLPRVRGRLTVCILPLFPIMRDGFFVWAISVFFGFTHFKTMNSFFLNCRLPPLTGEVPSYARR